MASSERLYPVLLVVPETPSRLKGPEKVSFLRNQARQALAISAQKSGLFLKSLDQAENGAPLPSDGVYWSLSHKESVVCAVAASMPVGIDVERIRPRSEALFKRIADAREWELSEGGTAWSGFIDTGRRKRRF